jgi:hypothetical protein
VEHDLVAMNPLSESLDFGSMPFYMNSRDIASIRPAFRLRKQVQQHGRFEAVSRPLMHQRAQAEGVFYELSSIQMLKTRRFAAA